MSKKLILERVLDASFLEGGLWEGFLWILGGFLMDFEGCGPHC